MALSADELRRYARHVVLPHVGIDGQERLRSASVLVVGLGGLGSPAALYLAAAGVGRLGLVDDDRVDEHNLQRQVLYGTSSLGERKADAAAKRVRDLNPYVRVEPHNARLTTANAIAIISQYDLVVDGTDQFATRYLINDACVIGRRPCVHGSVHRFEGQVSVFAAPDGPCYRCLFPEPPEPGSVPNCADGGVLGVLPGVVGSLQAAEAIKWIVGIGSPLVGRLLHFDALRMQVHEVSFARQAHCPSCGTTASRTLLRDYDVFCGSAPMEQKLPNVEGEMTPLELKTRLAEGWTPWLLDVREPWEHATAHLVGATLIPLGELTSRLDEVPRDQTIIVYCHHGMRSARAVSLLRDAGWLQVHNLAGGIDRWSIEADAATPRY